MTNESEGPAWTIMTTKSKKGDARHTILNTVLPHDFWKFGLALFSLSLFFDGRDLTNKDIYHTRINL